MRRKNTNIGCIGFLIANLTIVLSIIIDSVLPILILLILAVGGWLPIMVLYYYIIDKRDEARWRKIEEEQKKKIE